MRNILNEFELIRLFLTSANLSRDYTLPKINKKKSLWNYIMLSVSSPLLNFSKLLQNILTNGLK